MKTLSWCVPAVAVACSLSALPADAQTVRGVVQDPDGTAVYRSYVALMDRDQEVVAATFTDRGGKFEVTAPMAGQYYIYVTQVGYRSIFDGFFDLSSSEPLEVLVRIHPLPIALDSIRVSVEGEVARLAAVGYYERKASGIGSFLEREEILARATTTLTDALRSVSRVEIREPRPTVFGAGGLLNPEVVVRSGAGGCSPALVIDGAVAQRDGPLRPDDYVIPADVEAIEIYAGPAEAPPQYSLPGACAVMLIWSHHAPGGGAGS